MKEADIDSSSEEKSIALLTVEIISQCRERIHNFLDTHRECGEYDLIQEIANPECYSWSDDGLMALFQKHFIVQHCLYFLQKQYEESWKASRSTGNKCFLLEITPVKIRLYSAGPRVADTDFAHPTDRTGRAQLAEFYLNLDNFYSATPDTVAELIAKFWRIYDASQRSDEALTVLGLRKGADWKTIQARYRERITEAHPDKGGDPQYFIRLRQAYEDLKAKHHAK